MVHVVAPDIVGGAESVVRLLASSRAARGDPVHVVAILDADTHPFARTLRESGVAVEPIVVPARRYDVEWRRVKEALQRLGADVVHTHGYRADVVAGMVAWSLGLPVVTTVHGFTGGGWRNAVYERAQRAAFRRFAAVVAVSAPLGAQLAAHGSRLHVVPNAIEPSPALDRMHARAALGLDHSAPVAGWVGRLSPEKGLDVMLRALASPIAPAELRLAVIGDGPERTRLVALAARLGVGDRVSWLGAIPDAARLLRAFDLFVLSSRTEGTPMVLLEAMTAGVPIVASAVGGVPDVVGANSALLVKADAPAELAAALYSTLAERGRARERAAAAHACVTSRYAVGPWVDRYEMIYSAVRDARSTRVP